MGNCPIVCTVHNVPPEEHPFNRSFGSDVLISIVRGIYMPGISVLAKITIALGKYDVLISVSENTKKKTYPDCGGFKENSCRGKWDLCLGKG